MVLQAPCAEKFLGDYCRTIAPLPAKAAVRASNTLTPCFMPVLKYDKARQDTVATDGGS